MNITRIDLHTHSTVSDGTDTPEELLVKAKAAGIGILALTDHDAIKGYGMLLRRLGPGDPALISGVEFSCRDEEGKYHILGYGYDPDAASILRLVEGGHQIRIKKASLRLEHLKTAFGITFPEEEVRRLFSLDNPGKPHIANLMVKYGFAESKEQAMRDYLDRASLPRDRIRQDMAIRELLGSAFFPDGHIRPEQAIRGILGAGGVPVLAHPAFGSGEELVLGDELVERVSRLIGFGLQGIEAFYSGFTPRIRDEALAIAERYDLFVTAGSDYHGTNKLVKIGNTGLDPARDMPRGLIRFLERAGAPMP